MIQRWNYSLALVYLIHVMNGRCTMICVQCHLEKYLHGSKKVWIMHGKEGLWNTWIGDQIQVLPTFPPGLMRSWVPGANIWVPTWPPPFTIRGGHGVVIVWKINLSRGQLKSKKGTMMRTSLLRIQPRLFIGVGVWLIFRLQESTYLQQLSRLRMDSNLGLLLLHGKIIKSTLRRIWPHVDTLS
jgi:hypothetical protein